MALDLGTILQTIKCVYLSTVIRGAPRHVTGARRLDVGAPMYSEACRQRSVPCRRRSQACRRRSQTCRRRSLACSERSQLLPGAPRMFSGALRYSQTYHQNSHCTPVTVIRDPNISGGQPECPPRVRYSPEIDASMFTLQILSDTPAGSQ